MVTTDRRRAGAHDPRPRRDDPPVDRAGARGNRPEGGAVLRRAGPRTRPSRTSTRSDLTGSPTITVASPLFDQNGGGQRVAVLAANLQLERLDRIILERTGLGETGQTYLVGGDSRFVHERMNTGADANGVRLGRDRRRGRGQQRPGPVRGLPRRARDRRLPLAARSRGGARRRDLARTRRSGRPGSWRWSSAASGSLSALLLAIGICARRPARHPPDPRPRGRRDAGPGRRPRGDRSRDARRTRSAPSRSRSTR